MALVVIVAGMGESADDVGFMFVDAEVV